MFAYPDAYIHARIFLENMHIFTNYLKLALLALTICHAHAFLQIALYYRSSLVNPHCAPGHCLPQQVLFTMNDVLGALCK
jgi:hypothetical protein